MTLRKPDIQRDKQSLSSGSLTPELLRTFEGCEHYTIEEAEQIVCGLKQLACILFEVQQHVDNTTK